MKMERRTVKWSMTVLGVLGFIFIIFIVGRTLDSMKRDKTEKASNQQYSSFYMSENPLGPPITVIERSKMKPGYWLNYTTSRSNGCVVDAHVSLRWNTKYKGNALNAIWPLGSSSTKYEVVPTYPLRRQVAYYIRFDDVLSLAKDPPPLGSYSLQRLTEFQCGKSDTVSVAHDVDFELR